LASTANPLSLLIHVDRDSVCAGDDAEPHSATCYVLPTASVSELIDAALSVCRLASIAGGRATWLIEVGVPGRCVGVVAQQWVAPRLLAPNAAITGLFVSAARSVYFRYWAQNDPDLVFEALRAGRSLPDKYTT
jgi:hypothetical protein